MTREQAERERLLDKFAKELAEQFKLGHVTIKGAIGEAFRQGEQSGMIEASSPEGWELEAARAKLLGLIPKPGDFAYIEARVGSENYRKESHLIIDRRSLDPSFREAGVSSYDNFRANDWLAELIAAAAIIRKHAQGGKQ